MLEPKAASVEPRVFSPVSGDSLPLTEVVERHLGRHGVIVIHGPVGGGKTTALRHLLAVHAGKLVAFDEGASQLEIESAARRGLVVSVEARPEALEVLTLAPWGKDEAMEYLMSVHRARCADVMRRLAEHSDEFAESSPQLWCAVLDEMAFTDDVGPRDALAIAVGHSPTGHWMQHPLVRVLVEGRRIVDCVLGESSDEWPASHTSEDLAEAVRLLARRSEASAALRAAWASEDPTRQPLAASLLVGLGDDWRPDSEIKCHLWGAHLEDAPWSGVDLDGAVLRGARLHRAELCSASLHWAILSSCRARGANLDGARLEKARFDDADLGRTSFRDARAEAATFVAASLTGADFSGATLRSVSLKEADLRGARMVEADLSHATLDEARLEGADFSRANLSGARLRGLPLNTATWNGAHFEGADLVRCHLEGLELDEAAFYRAKLSRANLTGTVMPGACFRHARLESTSLGNISWPGADLRGADLSHAVFHMGSSRSGLVDSFLASEGTRTGY